MTNESTPSTPHTIGISLGSNTGDRMQMLRSARQELSRYMRITATSGTYNTKPLYANDQPPFLNAFICGETALDPTNLLYTIKDIENNLGRLPTFHYGPRAIDIDIIYYDDLQIHTPALSIPHPRMPERSFVLRPLAEINPDWQHPATAMTAAEMLVALAEGDRHEKRMEDL